VTPRRSKRDKQVLGLVGIGLDADDEHRRVTEAEDVLLVGGSEDTHGKMQDAVIRLNEKLNKKGKRVRDTESRELMDLLRECIE
jgi:hypothetical protein